MWKTLQQWVQHNNTERLGWAIFISLLLHAWLVGGNLISLPVFKQEMHTIEARLQAPKPAPKAPEPQAQPEKPAVKKPAKLKPEPEQAPEPIAPEPANPAPNVEPPAPAVEPAPAITNAAEAPPPADAQTAEPTPVDEDAGVIVNPNAYQYVATDFDVATKIDGAPEGTANITYDLYYEMHYKISSLTQASGLAGLIMGDLIQESKGELIKDGLQPREFLYQYGKKEDKTYRAKFNWQNMSIEHQTSKGIKTDTLLTGSQDLLSFMYQFMFVPPLQAMQIPITNGKKLRVYDYQFDGEELLVTPLGELNTVHVSRGGIEGEDNFELWLAPQYQYLPVKIRKTEKNGKVYEMKATRINIERPNPINY